MSIVVDDWLRCYRPATEVRMRMVCFPHGGGGASFFRRWAVAAPPSVEIHSVQYPGREDRSAQAPIAEMAPLAEQIARALVLLDDRPLALFGHSMGALVAYEVARRLERSGMPPLRVIVSGRAAPHVVRPQAKHLLDDAALWNDVARLGGTHEMLLESHELRALVLPTLRCDYRLVESYRFAGAPPLQAPIAAFAGDGDPEVTVEEAAAWSEHTRGAFDLRVFTGDHFYLIPEREAVLAAALRLIGAGSPEGGWPSAP